MAGKLRELTAGLKSTIRDKGGSAWSGYKGLIRGNPRGAMVGLGLAAGYGAWSEGHNTVEGAAILGPAAMGIGAAVGAGGGLGMLRNVGNQVARDLNTTIRAPLETGARPQFLERATINTDYVGMTGKALAGVEGSVPMHMQYAAIASEMASAPGEMAIPSMGQLAQDAQLGGYAGKFASKDAIMAAAGSNPEFAKQFAQRVGDFEGVGGFSTMTGAAEVDKLSFMGSSRKGLAAKLTAQGRGDLATQITGIDPSIGITGIGRGGQLSALEYSVGGTTFRAPIVGPDGTFKAGLFGQNTMVARQQVFMGSLESMAKGSGPKVMGVDMVVASTLRKYHAAAAETAGGSRALGRYLAGMSNLQISRQLLPGSRGLYSDRGTAFAWSNAYRKDRIGVPTSANEVIRGMDAQMTMPTGSLARAMGVESFMVRDSLTSETMLAMRAGGWAPYGSESGVRSNTFVNINRMSEMFPGSYVTPVDKAARGIRDYSKPYYITGGGATQRRPFTSVQRNKLMGAKSQGLAMHYNAIFESEADFLSELLNTGRKSGGLNPSVNKMIEGVMGESMSASQLRDMRAALLPIANMREGQFAAAIPQGAMMTTDVEKVVASVPDDIAGLKAGAAMPSNRPVGFDAANRPVSHTYSKLGGGTAVFKSITPIKVGGSTQYLIRWAEQQSAANVKYGSDVGKMFALEMKESQTPLAMRFINKLRRNKQMGGRLYGNQSYAPMIGAGAGNTAEAFTLAGTFGKFQSGPEVLMTSLHEGFVPHMSVAGRRKFRSMLRANSISVKGGGLVSNFGSPAGIESAYGAARAFAGEMVADPAAFGLRGDLFTGMGSDVTAEAAVLMRGGIVSEAMAWDALNLNVPGNVPITTNQLQMMKQGGMSASVAELAGRRKYTGDAKMTEAYKLALEKFVTPGARMSSNMPVIGIDEIPAGVGTATWRGSERMKQNFLINLEVADSQVNGALRKALGGNLQIPVPGSTTDFWHGSYRTPSGTWASSEPWGPSLRRLLESAGEMHQGVDASGDVKAALATYMNKIRGMDLDLTAGRGGTLMDAGPSIAGRMSFRDYGRQYKGHSALGGRASGFVTGINPEDFRRLAGGQEYARGIFTRFPTTSVDPSYFVPDATVARGEIAIDESRRALMGADFDGDTGYANLVKKGGSVSEIDDIVLGRGSLAAAYDEGMGARALLGGVGDDLQILGKASRAGGGGFKNIASAVGGRISKFASVFDQSAGTLLAKSYTKYIGRFSNLAGMYVSAGGSMSAPGYYARNQLLRDIQQAAIDFGRASKGTIEPEKIAMMLDEAVSSASIGAIDDANRLFATVMSKLNVGSEIDESLSILRQANAGNTKYLSALDTWADEIRASREQFFSSLTGNAEAQQEFGRIAKAQNLGQKRIYDSVHPRGSDEAVREAMVNMKAHLTGQATMAEHGVPSLGSASAGMGDTLTAMNRAKAAAKGSTHILNDVWKLAKSSPHFGNVKAGAIATGAMVGLNLMFNSPSDMRAPAYEGAGRALQMAPDRALAAMSQTVMPGGSGGRVGDMSNPRRVSRPPTPQNMIPRRYYVNQTNRTSRVRYSGSGDPFDQNQYARDVGDQMRNLSGGRARINVVHDATSRRMSELEFEDKMRNDLRGGR